MTALCRLKCRDLTLLCNMTAHPLPRLSRHDTALAAFQTGVDGIEGEDGDPLVVPVHSLTSAPLSHSFAGIGFNALSCWLSVTYRRS